MAAINMWVHFRETPDVDGLCPKCFNPALKRYTLQRVDMDGITFLGQRVACRDCKDWVTPLEEFIA
jgi:hypothetical protein